MKIVGTFAKSALLNGIESTKLLTTKLHCMEIKDRFQKMVAVKYVINHLRDTSIRITTGTTKILAREFGATIIAIL